MAREISVRDRLAIAPTINTSGLKEGPENLLRNKVLEENVLNQRENVLNQREDKFLSSMSVDRVNAVNDRDRQKQFDMIKEFDEKWTEVYRDSSGRLSTEQKLELASEKRGIAQKQSAILQVHDDYTKAAALAQLKPDLYDLDYVEKALLEYEKNDKVPPGGFLRYKGTNADAQANAILKATSAGHSATTRGEPTVDAFGQLQYTETKSSTLTKEQSDGFVDAQFQSEPVSRVATLDESWSTLNDFEKKKYTDAYGGDMDAAKDANHKDLVYGRVQSAGVSKEKSKNLPKDPNAKKVFQVNENGDALFGEDSFKLSEVEDGRLVSANPEKGTVRISRWPYEGEETINTYSDKYVASKFSSKYEVKTWNELNKLYEKELADDPESEDTKELFESIETTRQSYYDHIATLREKGKLNKQGDKVIVNEPDEWYGGYLDSVEIKGVDVEKKEGQSHKLSNGYEYTTQELLDAGWTQEQINSLK